MLYALMLIYPYEGEQLIGIYTDRQAAEEYWGWAVDEGYVFADDRHRVIAVEVGAQANFSM